MPWRKKEDLQKDRKAYIESIAKMELPPYLSVHIDSGKVFIDNHILDKSTVIPLYAYQYVRQALSDLFVMPN